MGNIFKNLFLGSSDVPVLIDGGDSKDHHAILHSFPRCDAGNVLFEEVLNCVTIVDVGV